MRRLLAVFAICVGLPVSVWGTQASVTLLPGPLEVSTPKVIATQAVSPGHWQLTLSPINVIDAGRGHGWHVQLQARTADSASVIALTLPAADDVYAPDDSANAATVLAMPITLNGSTLIADAAPGRGLGTFRFTGATLAITSSTKPVLTLIRVSISAGS
jgi:hypothetical protein